MGKLLPWLPGDVRRALVVLETPAASRVEKALAASVLQQAVMEFVHGDRASDAWLTALAARLQRALTSQ